MGTRYTGESDEIAMMAKGLFELGAKTVLIKGGHSQDKEYATDYLVEQTSIIVPFRTARLQTVHTHGTGCVLSISYSHKFGKE